ncbi:MAG: hypothetical protein ABJN40_20110 [Sneathiella sp.]
MIGGGKIHIIAACAILLVVGACTDALPPQPVKRVEFSKPPSSDLDRVWQNALVAIPVRGTTGSLLTTAGNLAEPPQKLAGVGPDTRWPIVVALASCVRPIDAELMRKIAEQGFVVISPSSSSRYFEPLKCVKAATPAENAASSIRARKLEIAYILRQLKTQTWTDNNNLFLIGFQDAAAAVARFTGSVVKARVLAEWACEGEGAVKGIAAVEKSPVLAVTSTVTPTYGGGCGKYLHVGGGSQILALPQKYSKNILLEPVIYTQLLKFFDAQIFN